jgi:hypothetical protein
MLPSYRCRVRRTGPRLLLALLTAVACGGKAAPRPAPPPPAEPRPEDAPASARRIADPADLIPGSAASGQLGDYRLDNGLVAFVVSDAPIAYGFSETGGNLVDAAPRGGRDALAQVYLYLDDTFPRQGRNGEVRVSAAGGDEAAIEVRGVDSKDPSLAIVHEYRLRRGADALLLRTTITNTGAAPVPAYDVGDVISWGQAEHFAPGHGFVFRGRLEVPWLAAVADASSYGYTAAEGTLLGPHGSSWSDTILRTVDLAPGASVTVERWLVVQPRADVAGVLARILELRRTGAAPFGGQVLEAGTGAPVADALVTAWDEAGKPVAVARTGADGRFAFDLPLPAATFSAAGPGRMPVGEAVPARGGDLDVRLVVTQPARVRVIVRERRPDGTTAPSPARLVVRGVAPTADPVLGPRYRAAGAGNTVASGTGHAELVLAPGRYRLYAMRGPERTLWSEELDLAPGQTVDVAPELTTVVDTRGWVSADFHQHALPSPDSAVALEDRLVANVAEGVEIAVATDHNQITDYAPTLAGLELAAPLATIVGLEATTETIGHFQVYPITRHAGASRGGAPLVDGKTPTEIFALVRALAPDVVVQVNHPRALTNGYFRLGGLPTEPSEPAPAGFELGFDAIEVLNGKRIADFDQVLRDWFRLLAAGREVTATGGSDSHYIVGQEVGWPRAYLHVDTDDPLAVDAATVLDVVKRRRAVLVTNGPFFTLTVDGQSAVGTRHTRKKGTPLEVSLVVQAAPWVDVDRVELYRDGTLVRTLAVPASTAPVRLRETLRLDKPGFWVVVVRGDGSLDPVIPDDDGRPVTPVAVANPVWLAWP